MIGKEILLAAVIVSNDQRSDTVTQIQAQPYIIYTGDFGYVLKVFKKFFCIPLSFVV
ncbi:hypothetical protein SDC9_198522 [bioreactor metagenome]|uniref:Uncharacterized protein n=1 Tax=bioreactor metagenome TaxID=1076179 RepID=A0A645IJ60_9ZZZZ